MLSLKVDEGADESKSAEKTQAAQLRNTSLLGRTLGAPPGLECPAASKNRKRSA